MLENTRDRSPDRSQDRVTSRRSQSPHFTTDRDTPNQYYCEQNRDESPQIIDQYQCDENTNYNEERYNHGYPTHYNEYYEELDYQNTNPQNYY